MNLEGIPRYDHIFIIMLENKATQSIKNSIFAPHINEYLTRRQPVHQLLRHRQPERAEPHRREQRRRLRHHRRQRAGTACRPATRRTPSRTRCRPDLAPCTQRDQPQHEEAEPVHRDDARGHDVAGLQRVDESRPRLASERRRRTRRSSRPITSTDQHAPASRGRSATPGLHARVLAAARTRPSTTRA